MFYNAFQASLNKRFANGFNFLAAYTFAKNLGNADGNVGGFIQNSYRADLEHGPVTPICAIALRSVISMNFLSGVVAQFLTDVSGVADGLSGRFGNSPESHRSEREAVRRRYGKACRSDLSNTGSFSYRPDQDRQPLQLLLQPRITGDRLWLYQSRHQTLDLLVPTRPHLSPRRWHRANNPPHALAIPGSEPPRPRLG